MASKNVMLNFNNGRSYPQVGLGTWLAKDGNVIEAVKYAIDAGYRHIDCAFGYGNENEVGAGIKAKIDEGVVKREELFITSKLWNTYHRKDLVIPALKKSLELLKLDYIDLYMMHWPMAYKEGSEIFPVDKDGKMVVSDCDYLETWKAMEEGYKLGLAKSIGVCNFNSKQLDRLISAATVKPVVNQVECHPYLNQKKLIEFCKSKDVMVTAYSPLGAPARPWAKADDVRLLDNAGIADIAKKHNKTTAQVLIRYQMQRGLAVIPKSVTKERIISNFDVFNFELSNDDMKFLDSLDCNMRMLHLDWMHHHKDHPFKDCEF